MKILQRIREVWNRAQARVTEGGPIVRGYSAPPVAPINYPCSSTRAEVVRLRSLGMKLEEIAAELGISFQAVSVHLRKHIALTAPPPPPPPPPKLLKNRAPKPEPEPPSAPTPFAIDYARVAPKPEPLPPAVTPIAPPPAPRPAPPPMPKPAPIAPMIASEPAIGFRPIIAWSPPAEELLPIPIAPLPAVPSGIAGVNFINVTADTRAFFLIAHDPPSSLTGMNYTVDDWYHPAIVHAEYMNDPQQGLFTNAEKIIVIVEADDIVFLTSIARSSLADRCVVAQGIFQTGQQCWQELSKPDDRGFHTRYSEPSGRTLADFAKKFPPMPPVTDVEAIRGLCGESPKRPR